MLQDSLKFIWYDKPKALGIFAGIFISIFLVGQQLGIFISIVGNMKGLAKYNEELIWVIHEETQNATQLKMIDNRIGRSVKSIKGVKTVYPLVQSGGTLKLYDGTKINISMLGLEIGNIPGDYQKLLNGIPGELLMTEGAFLLDKIDRSALNDIDVNDKFLVNGRRMQVVGFTEGNAGFGASNVVTTIERARALGGISVNKSHAFLLEWDSTQISSKQVIGYVNDYIPGARALTGQQFGDDTYSHMMTTNNIAASFAMMIIFALLTGCVIVGLTMYSSVNDRIRDYGTIKAIGGDNGYIRQMILKQSMIYAIVGFLLAYGGLMIFKAAMAGGVMVFKLPLALLAGLFLVTLFMCIIGSWFALRIIVQLEPVQIFRM